MTEDVKAVLLLVDDNNKNLQVLGETLDGFGYELAFAMSGRQVFEYLSVEKPDMILLDVMMPEMDGFEICTKIKSNDETKDIPIIFLTARTGIDEVVKGFEAGGIDYITKPFNSLELKTRVKTHLALKQSMDKLRTAYEIINQKNRQLNEIMEQLDYASKTDPLTELYNRRYLGERLNDEVIRNTRSRQAFSVIIADIDFFKKVNDTYGHPAGDYVLKTLAELFKITVRQVDSVARWGGEEFLFFLPETNYSGAYTLAEVIRKRVEEKLFSYEGKEFKITLTLGVSEYSEEDGLDQLLKVADDALYEGKRSGRNCVR